MLSGKMYRFRLPEAHFDSRYLEAFLQTSAAQHSIDRMKTGGSDSGLNLTHDRFRQLDVPVAPLNEQRRIVAKLEELLSELDAGVESLKTAREQLKVYRQALLKHAFEGKLTAAWRSQNADRLESANALLERILREREVRWEESAKNAGANDPSRRKYRQPAPPDVTGMPVLPNEWVWTTIEAVGDVLLGRQRAPQFLTGRNSRPYLRVANVADDKLDYSDVKEMDFDTAHFEKYRLAPGDILVSEGQSRDLVGQSAIYEGGMEGLCFQKTLHRFRRYGAAPDSRFVQLIFRTYLYTGVFRRAASLSVNIAHLTLERFSVLPFPLPPLAEQQRILDEVDWRLSVVYACETEIDQQLQKSESLRQSILKRAFAGQLIPQDPSDEPASVLLERIRAEKAAGNAKPSKRQRRASKLVAN
jgi:type I restriction enzyme S subunit